MSKEAKQEVPKKTIYELDMHEATFQGAMEVLRVPGGWLYTWVIDSKKRLAMSTTFVPFSET